MTDLHTRPIPTTSDRTRRTRHASIAVEIPEITEQLLGILGKHLLALIVGKDPRTVQRWASGQTRPATRDEVVLRNTHQIHELLAAEEGAHTIRAWFMGMNPQLDDESPAEALANGKARAVLSAARAFLAGG